MMEISKAGIKYFGTILSEQEILEKINSLQECIDKTLFYLVIAGTNTSQVEGISAAGIDPVARKKTALADAEFLLFGPTKNHKYKLPLLSAGVTPALISYSCAKLIRAKINIVPIGLDAQPYFNHIKLEEGRSISANCVSSGQAMPLERVIYLFERGVLIGCSTYEPLFIAESVPGGTTTAQAVMQAFGLNVSKLVGSSLINPPRQLKDEIISKGLKNANLKNNFDVFDVIAGVGDPFQAFSLGLLIGARKRKRKVILSGGSQMLALLVLALELIKNDQKQELVEQIFVITTNWLVRDNSLNDLLKLIANKHKVDLIGLASCLNFKSSTLKELNDYELGYVKEGVGAGGMSILANLKGFDNKEIINECEINLRKMKVVGQCSSNSENVL
tara:strand:- start:608 stop:1774 length:1167 start_codon:yes stop_codon:yes gene_type:complete